ncbi:MAG: L-threonylcarbamoyladenylate synthase [Candidatus Thorarchaeota archaeon]
MTAKTIVLQETGDYSKIIIEAAEILLSGNLVVYPTDTSYGLACDARQMDALEKLVAAKKRSPNLGVPLLFSDKNQISDFHDFRELEIVIGRLFWPGPLTLVVPTKESVPSILTGGRDSVAIRIPNHVIPRGIANELGYPIVGTSANLSGGPSPFDISTAQEQLGDKVDLYIDGGPSSSRSNSTIVSVVEDEKGTSSIKVYREGELSIDEIKERLRVDTDAQRFWTSRIVHADM